MEMMLLSIQKLGIDVSKYQQTVDWSKVANDGIKFAIIRAGYGSLVSQEDGYFKINYSGANKAGLPTGSYWYSYAKSVNEIEAEAEACLKVLDGRTFIYPVFIDLEEHGSILGKTVYTNMAIAFCKKIAAAGYKAGVYANKYFLINYIDTSRLDNYYIWLAHYTTNTDYAGRYDMHQFSHTGSVNGISGNVDLNHCYIDFTGSSGPSEPSNPGTSLVAGSKLTLNSTALYVSATAANKSTTKTGTFYVYDSIVINGRIRITNSSNNVGRTPMSTYVTGWINVSGIGGSTSPSYAAGTKLSLSNVNLYVSADAKTAANRVSGTYYLYDGLTNNGKMRITNSLNNVGRTPMSSFVTGWINKTDI